MPEFPSMAPVRLSPAPLLLLAGLLVAMVVFVDARTPQKSNTPPRKPASAQTRKAQRADSVARAAADSVGSAARSRALADSLRRADSLEALRRADSLTAVRRADSLKAPRYRKVKNSSFNVGERLVFDVSYGFITAGEAVMHVAAFDSIAGRRTYRVQFTVNSLPSFSWIYRVEDRYLTFIDYESIAPLRFEQHIQEGSYKRDFTAEFDQMSHIARTSEGQYPIPEYVHDILSAFYFVRTVDFSGLKTGDTIKMYNFYKDKSHDLVVRLLGRQELEVGAGTFRSLVVEPLVKEGGLFKSEGRIVIWLTDDDVKMPIRVNTKVIIGSIDVELREYSGLPGPVKAKMN
jgi:hypothetical protein